MSAIPKTCPSMCKSAQKTKVTAQNLLQTYISSHCEGMYENTGLFTKSAQNIKVTPVNVHVMGSVIGLFRLRNGKVF